MVFVNMLTIELGARRFFQWHTTLLLHFSRTTFVILTEIDYELFETNRQVFLDWRQDYPIARYCLWSCSWTMSINRPSPAWFMWNFQSESSNKWKYHELPNNGILCTFFLIFSKTDLFKVFQFPKSLASVNPFSTVRRVNSNFSSSTVTFVVVY